MNAVTAGGDPFLPKVTYQPEDIVKFNPYDFKDDAYLAHLEKERIDHER